VQMTDIPVQCRSAGLPDKKWSGRLDNLYEYID
jgi:hypothetical protein